jgi:hypothetical protein
MKKNKFRILINLFIRERRVIIRKKGRLKRTLLLMTSSINLRVMGKAILLQDCISMSKYTDLRYLLTRTSISMMIPSSLLKPHISDPNKYHSKILSKETRVLNHLVRYKLVQEIIMRMIIQSPINTTVTSNHQCKVKGLLIRERIQAIKSQMDQGFIIPIRRKKIRVN